MISQIQIHYRGPWYSWGVILVKVKKHMFDCWKVYYYYDDQYKDDVWREFKRVGSGMCRRAFSRQRQIDEIPCLDWVPEHCWEIMKQRWEAEDFKKKSEQNKKNWKSYVAANTIGWKGGSITSTAWNTKLTVRFGQEPEPDQLFLHTFGKDGVLPEGEGRAKEIVDEYWKALAAADDLEAKARIDRYAIWDSVAVDSRGRTVGMGNLAHSTHRRCLNPLAQHNILLQTRVDDLEKRGSKQAKDNRKLKKRLSYMEENHKSLLESRQPSKQQYEHHPDPNANMNDEYGTSASEDEVDDDLMDD
ncbi:Transposase, Ptta/En/Spm, plant [Corchorus capsularis]|uniref:Transposase, Ptta/En/Spm, plant n=1 Tax=Corchorus capsularis TaxID=210143 RepID=A0A1R3KBS7_COCAP|nr:Transposase, Ptta/En/Spm, plant [Corchorus capsularis]